MDTTVRLVVDGSNAEALIKDGDAWVSDPERIRVVYREDLIVAEARFEGEWKPALMVHCLRLFGHIVLPQTIATAVLRWDDCLAKVQGEG